jgi:hypothetical protein
MPGEDDEDEEVIVVQPMEDKVWDRVAWKLRELVKKQLTEVKSAPAFFALAAFHCSSEFVAAFTAVQLALASRCDAWFAFSDAGLAMVPSVGTAAAAKAAHALECVSMFGDFVAELEPRWTSERFRLIGDPVAGLSWKGGGDAGAGVSRAADLLDSAAEAHERAKGKRPAGVNASTINNPKTRAAAQEAMDDPFSGATGADRGTCPC